MLEVFAIVSCMAFWIAVPTVPWWRALIIVVTLYAFQHSADMVMEKYNIVETAK